MKDIMIDIETLGNKGTSAVATIGAVEFGAGFVTENTFYTRIDWIDALKYGTMDASSMKWWMNQNDEARAEMTKDGAISLKKGLRQLADWMPKPIDEVRVWGNGSVFDIAILNYAFNQVQVKLPWHFRNVRDVRTVTDLTYGHIDPKDYVDGTVAHNALSDAIYQANYLSDMLKKIEDALKK